MFGIVTDARNESRLPLYNSLKIYVPRDERFSHLKMSDFAAYAVKSIFQFLVPEFEAVFNRSFDEFDKIEDILKLYEGGVTLSDGPILERIRDHIPSEMIKELLRSDGEPAFKFPMPQVIQGTKNAATSDMTLSTLKSNLLNFIGS